MERQPGRLQAAPPRALEPIRDYAVAGFDFFVSEGIRAQRGIRALRGIRNSKGNSGFEFSNFEFEFPFPGGKGIRIKRPVKCAIIYNYTIATRAQRA